MIDDVWKSVVDSDMKRCHESGIRLQEADKHQNEKIDKNEELIDHLYDYKNDTYRKITFMEANQIGRKEFNALSKCVNTLKTEKKFWPWLVMIVSAGVAAASIVLRLMGTTQGG